MSSSDQANVQPAAELVIVPTRTTRVSDELGKIMRALRDACPQETTLTFEYDGTLRVHIDVRRVEDVTQVEFSCRHCAAESSVIRSVDCRRTILSFIG